MSDYKPRGFVQQTEFRTLTREEQLVVQYLEHAVARLALDIKSATKNHKYGTASNAQLTALALQNALEAIQSGDHDPDHPTRHIVPSERAEKRFALTYGRR